MNRRAKKHVSSTRPVLIEVARKLHIRLQGGQTSSPVISIEPVTQRSKRRQSQKTKTKSKLKRKIIGRKTKKKRRKTRRERQYQKINYQLESYLKTKSASLTTSSCPFTNETRTTINTAKRSMKI